MAHHYRIRVRGDTRGPLIQIWKISDEIDQAEDLIAETLITDSENSPVYVEQDSITLMATNDGTIMGRIG